MSRSLFVVCALIAACGEPAGPAGIELSVTTDKAVYSLSADPGAQPLLVNRGVREVYLPMNEYVAVQRFEAGAWSDPQPWFAVDGVGISFPLAASDTLRAWPMSFGYVGRQVGVYRFIFDVAARPGWPDSPRRIGASLGPVRNSATRRTIPVLFALPLVVGACDILGSQVCTAHIAPGITVTITDSVSGEPRAADAVAVAREGAFVDTLGPAVSQGNVMISRQGAHERPGIYEVLVGAPGYADWVQNGVMVRPGDCHLKSVQLEARLQVTP